MLNYLISKLLVVGFCVSISFGTQGLAVEETLNNPCLPSSDECRTKPRFRIPQTVSSLLNPPNEISPRIRKTAVTQCFLGNLNQLVGQAVWDSLPDQNPEFVSAFLQGMQEKKGEPTEQDILKVYNEEQQAKGKLRLKEQLLEADHFFQKLQCRKDVEEVVPLKVYFQVEGVGTGQQTCELTSEVIATYRIETIGGQVLSIPDPSQKNTPLPISGLMPGLAKGMVGMKEGEKRKIYIQPEYGYSGIFSLDGHPGLIVHVELASTTKSTNQQFTVEPITFSVMRLDKQVLEREYQRAHLRLAYLCGQATWTHYKWGEPKISLEKVIHYIRRAIRNENLDLSSSEMQKWCLDLHWALYQKRDAATNSQKNFPTRS